MIAALAAGLLGQLEGIGASAGLSAASSLFATPDGQAAQPDAAPVPKAVNGRPAVLQTLSDQMHGLLLQQQSGQSALPPGSVQADDVTANPGLA